MSATDYQPGHGHGIDDECTSGHIPRHVALDPRDGCPVCRWVECRCDHLLDSIVRDLTNPMPCRRCDDDPTAIRTCAACLAEIQMRDDDESHANECARYDFAQSALADDERDES